MQSIRYKNITDDLIAACRQASRIIRADFLRAVDGDIIERQEKSCDRHSLPDFVTKTDQEAEALIQACMTNKWPDIPFVGEENGASSEGLSRYFLVDPLDGTSNFAALRAYFSISAAYIEDNDVKAAVIIDPLSHTWVSAYQGGGAKSETGKSLRVAETESLKAVQLDCEFPMTTTQEMETLQKLLPHLSGFRKNGSTALDVMRQAFGQKSAVISSCLAPHDIAASLLIAKEAGARITEIDGRPATLTSTTLLCAEPRAHQQLLSALNPA